MANEDNKNLSLDSILSEFRSVRAAAETGNFENFEVPTEDMPANKTETDSIPSPEDFLRDNYPQNEKTEAGEDETEAAFEEEDPLEDISDEFIPEEEFYSAREEKPEEDEKPHRSSRLFGKKYAARKSTGRYSEMGRRLLKTFGGSSEEDDGEELSPKAAAKHYAAQLPSIKWRTTGAFVVCILMAWITFAADRGWPMPGQLQTDIRLCAAVLLSCEITVLLLGLDVLTAGIVSLFRGKPGAETVIASACIFSAVEAAVIIGGGITERGVPCCVLPAFSVACALLGAKWNCMSFQRTFLSLHHARRGYAITAEDLPEREERVIIKSKRDFSGFVRRTEEPDYAESFSSGAALPMLLCSLIIAGAVTAFSGDKGAFFHIFALLLSLCAGFNWLLAIPMLFNKASKHLLGGGSALAGWNGAVDLGTSRRLIITDTDIFPEGAIEITGVRVLDKENADKIISVTGSMLSAADTGTASVFVELMRRSETEMKEVETLTVGEGGVRGKIDEEEIRVGNLSYMHLSGVKIPDKIKTGDAVYTAIGGELAGIFLFRYRPLASVQRALANLRRARRKPIFAVRDFNIDPLLLKKNFDISTEGFEFPTIPERYRISDTPFSCDSPVAAAITQGGLELLEDAAETGTQLYRLGRACVMFTLLALAFNVLLSVPGCIQCAWESVSVSRFLILMVLQVIFPVFATLLERK